MLSRKNWYIDSEIRIYFELYFTEQYSVIDFIDNQMDFKIISWEDGKLLEVVGKRHNGDFV